MPFLILLKRAKIAVELNFDNQTGLAERKKITEAVRATPLGISSVIVINPGVLLLLTQPPKIRQFYQSSFFILAFSFR